MSKIVFTNKSATEGLSFTSHGNGRIDLAPAQVLEMELDNAKGPFILNYLEAFYAKYADKMTVAITLDGEGGSEVAVPNMPASTATSYTQLKEDFNKLIENMKVAGLMIANFLPVTAALVPSPTEADGVANNSKVKGVTFKNNVITLDVNVDELVAFESSDESQGTHKWIALGIATGLDDITDVEYDGSALSDQDVEDATAVGLPAGSFVLYIKADEVSETPKELTLAADDYDDTPITIVIK